MSLDTAPDHIKLAVDLIELLETNEVDPYTAEQALFIVLKDYQNKIAVLEKTQSKELSLESSEKPDAE